MNVKTQNYLNNIEKGFNIAGCIPIVCFYSGTLRMTAGKIEAIAGAFMTIAGLISYEVTKEQKYDNWSKLGIEFIVQGVLNTFRGYGEIFLFRATFIGNLGLLIPNIALEDKFGPMLPYGKFTANKTKFA